MSAAELSGEEVGVVAHAPAILHVLAAAPEHLIGCLPERLVHDGRNDLTGLVLEHDPFLRREEFLLFGEQVDDLDLVAHVVALVFGVCDHAGHGGVGDLFAVVVAVALFPEAGLDLLHGVVPGGVEGEQLPYHGSLGLVDDQPSAVLPVAEDPAVAQHHAVFDGLLMAEFHTAGELAQLVLGDAGHDGQPQLAVLVQRVDVVVLEKSPHPGGEQPPGVLDGVQGVAGKAGDLLGEDEVKAPGLPVLNHPVEILPLFGGGGGESLIDVAVHIGPAGIPADQVPVVLDLVAQGVQLFVGLAGHPGIEGDVQGQIIDGLGFQLLADAVDVHGACLRSWSYHHYYKKVLKKCNEGPESGENWHESNTCKAGYRL